MWSPLTKGRIYLLLKFWLRFAKLYGLYNWCLEKELVAHKRNWRLPGILPLVISFKETDPWVRLVFTMAFSMVFWSSPVVKNLPAMQETWVQSLGRKDPLEKEMATHSSILAWEIPWTEEPSRLQSMGSQIIGHDYATEHTHSHNSFSLWLSLVKSWL